ncbi:MAG: S9 family peptidase [Bacteroidales bacterium]|nr:S9 family peptidase [Bacteroidales bacterium]
MKKILLLLGMSVILFSCQQNKNIHSESTSEKIAGSIIDKQDLKLSSDIMTPEVLWSFGRISEVELSPDKKDIIYGVTYYSIKENKGNRDLYKLNLQSKIKTRLTETQGSEYNAVWKPDGSKIGYLSAESGSMQMWEMNPDGSGKTQISDIKDGINGFKYSPDMNKIVFIAEVKLDTTAKDKHPDLDKTTAQIYTDMMFRHWDHWVETYSHVFLADYDGKSLSNAKDLMPNEMWESPVRPWGGMEQINFTADGKNVVYTSRKKRGVTYAISTNTDLYQYNIASGETKNLTQGMMGYDMEPTFSSDGKFMAFTSMARDGYESDKTRLMIMNLESGETKDLTASIEQNAGHLSFSEDNKSVYFISDWHATDEIYRVDIENAEITKITEGVHNYLSVVDAGEQLVATKVSMSQPAEIYIVNKNTGKDEEVSFENKDLMTQLSMGEVKSKWIPTTDGKEMLVWYILPPHFDSTKTYPAILYCQGGPQGTVSQFWSYRWNFQMMAANGYIVVAPNRRGLPGFGIEWNEQISGDYGGQNMKDYLSAIDDASKEPFVDADKLGAVGASYGGFSVYWLAGHHNKRFKAFIAHNGIFNLESQYTETEEMWFANWDLGGAYWDLNNEVAQNTYKNSPHKFVQNWDTPIYVIHSDKDYRIAYTQGMQAFDAARLRGIDAKWLYFPDETHFVVRPQNAILWQREFFSWLDKYLK